MTESTNPVNQVTNRGTSIPLLIGLGILGVVAYFAGKPVMTYVMFLQEQAKAKTIDESNGKAKSRNAGDIVQSPQVPPMVSLGGPGGPGGGRPDPEEMFKRRDADGNGKLEGTEISERMQARIAEIDQDADGAVTKEEFLAGVQIRQAPSGNSAGAPADPPTAEITLESGTAPATTANEPNKEAPKDETPKEETPKE